MIRSSSSTTGTETANGRVDLEVLKRSLLERLAVFAMTFGPGAAVATYTSLFGWYQHQYEDRGVLVWMRLALFAPFPVMTMLQLRFDAYFDEKYGTEAMYLFRLVVMQLVVSLLMSIWMFLPLEFASLEAVRPIVAFGGLLGACCAPFIGSSIQIAVAIDPVLLIWAQLGNSLGMSVPVLATLALGFEPGSSHADLDKIIAVPLFICCLTSAALAAMHFSGVFHKAHKTITKRRPSKNFVAHSQVMKGNKESAQTVGATAQDTIQMEHLEIQDLSPTVPREADDTPFMKEQEGLPWWVYLWLTMQSSGIMVDFFLLTLIGYFGDAHTTHNLAAGALVGSGIGRLLSLPCRYLPAWKRGPMHTSSAMLFILRLGLWFPLFLEVFQVLHMSTAVLLPLWCSWITFSMLHNSFTETSVAANVLEEKRQWVARLQVTSSFSGLLIGLLTASVLVQAGMFIEA